MNVVVMRFARGSDAHPLPDLEQVEVFGPFGTSQEAIDWRDEQNQAGHFYLVRELLVAGAVVPLAGTLRMGAAMRAKLGEAVAVEPRVQLKVEHKCPICSSTMRPFQRPDGQLDCSLCEAVVKLPDSKG